MVLGVYYLTSLAKETPIQGRFASIDAVMTAYHASLLDIKDMVLLKWENHFIETTVGRAIFNHLLPEKVRYVNEKVTKKGLKKILDVIFDNYGKQTTVQVADAIKDR